MPPQLTDGLILGALLTILAWLFARAVSRKDSPDYGSDDLYLAIVLAEWGSEAASVNRSGGGKASGKADRLVGNGSHNHRGKAK